MTRTQSLKALLIVLAVAVFLVLVSGCKGSTGSTGPQGAAGTGTPGQNGAPGGTGGTGAAGTSVVWDDGTGNPTSATGTTDTTKGDFYLDIASGNVWQLQSSGWVQIANIKGLPGANGNPGGTGGTGAQGNPGGTGGTGGTGGVGGTGGTGGIGATGTSTAWINFSAAAGVAPTASAVTDNGDWALNFNSLDVWQATGGTWVLLGNLTTHVATANVSGNIYDLNGNAPAAGTAYVEAINTTTGAPPQRRGTHRRVTLSNVAASGSYTIPLVPGTYQVVAYILDQTGTQGIYDRVFGISSTQLVTQAATTNVGKLYVPTLVAAQVTGSNSGFTTDFVSATPGATIQNATYPNDYNFVALTISATVQPPNWKFNLPANPYNNSPIGLTAAPPNEAYITNVIGNGVGAEMLFDIFTMTQPAAGAQISGPIGVTVSGGFTTFVTPAAGVLGALTYTGVTAPTAGPPVKATPFPALVPPTPTSTAIAIEMNSNSGSVVDIPSQYAVMVAQSTTPPYIQTLDLQGCIDTP